jgi:hypothetical protein
LYPFLVLDVSLPRKPSGGLMNELRICVYSWMRRDKGRSFLFLCKMKNDK